MSEAHDIPLAEAVAQCEELVASGATVYFKYTCAGCGERRMFDVPNTVYRTARCEDCGHVTDLEEQGVGYMLVLGGRR